jgi:uncharacterized protein YdeI (YjbR/CyaY-like superfamily)
MQPVFFATAKDFRSWLDKHHEQAEELLVGFYKKSAGIPSITWPEAVAEALCFGWIDGIRKSLDSVSYTIRFTPRRARSTWSEVNIKLVAKLSAAGAMRPAGLRAFEARMEEKSGIYAYEQRKTAELPAEYARMFRAKAAAWRFFQDQPGYYRRTITWWVVSAKKEETRLSRFEKLLSACARKERLL